MRTPAILLAVAFALAGCADDDATANTDTTADTSADITSETTASDPDAAPAVPVDPDASNDLDPDEIAGLLWMREEEQLAHDVYSTLDARWDVPVFSNIARSEQQHIESATALLERYGIDDPAAGNAPGTFTDPTIQQLYDELVAEGSTSLAAALSVGATVEELDIADLRARTAATDEAAIVDVYQRLERGSRNHLRAFVRRLDRLGESYEPTLLDDFDEIVDSPMERGADV